MASIKVGVNLDMQNSATLDNLPNASSGKQPVNLDQLNLSIQGLKSKVGARVSTQANINLASPGAAIDTKTMVIGDVVLVRFQTTQSQNGLYTWNGSAAQMTRTSDSDTSIELENAVVNVYEGTDVNKTFRQTTTNFTLGTGNVVFIPFGSAPNQATESAPGVAEIATQSITNLGANDTDFVTPMKLANSPFARRSRVDVIGDGSSTLFTITHNFNTRNVGVEIVRNVANYDTVLADVRRPTLNTVTVEFSTLMPPSSNEYNVLIWVSG